MGWQTMLADLSLILFMVSAAAMADAPNVKQAMAAAPPAPAPGLADPARAEPLAVWIAAPGAPPLAGWLAAQQADARQQLTIIARYPSGGAPRALAQAEALAASAGRLGARARIIVEPEAKAADASQSELRASLAYDLAPDAAR